MRALSSVGIGLTLVSGCLLLALIAELYYLLWWKKNKRMTAISDRDIRASPAKELLYYLCWNWKKPHPLSSTAINPMQASAGLRDSDESDDVQLKPFGEDSLEDNLQAELMRLHGLSGPTRFLFTIKEETREDLESEDGISRGGRSRKCSRGGGSLGDLLLAPETPFMTPLSSPPFFTPPLTPLDCYNHHGFNPLFESGKDGLGLVRSSTNSPPPKFKFLKDAEEKLYRKTLKEEALRVHRSGGLVWDAAMPENAAKQSPFPSPPPQLAAAAEEEDGSFITIVIDKHRERAHQHQVIPLASSPSNIRPAIPAKPTSNLCSN